QERRAPPERKRLLGPPFLGQPLEFVQVELARLDAERVTGTTRHQPTVAELFAQMGNAVVEDLRGCGRWLLAPQLVDQAAGRHDLVRVQEQKGEESLLFPAADRQR